jgi:demethylmenaquinone methyltransferase / 2-methoxy-6-polyprenyl-1,4-benzoquinol methylase
MTRNPEQFWFGNQGVDATQKTEKVLGVFSSVAKNYDLMNDVMSFGLHRLWKDRFVRLAAPEPGMDIIDVAGGTGDIAFRLHRATGGQAPITVYDINPDMLRVGRDRALDRGILKGLTWTEGDAAQLPFPDSSFDLYTIAFGLRNVTQIDDALAEAHRVLRPGGRFCCLEFSQVRDRLFDKIYQAYSTHVIPGMGALIAQDRNSYQYLVESIRKFPTQAQLASRLKAAGFDAVRVTNVSGGIAAIHIAEKY